MKFGKELESDLVPEWRAKYLDYRSGKKKFNAVTRAYRSVNVTPRTPRRRTADLWHGLNQPTSTSSPQYARTRPRSFVNRGTIGYVDPDGTGDYLRHQKPPSRHDTSSSEGDVEEGREDVVEASIPTKLSLDLESTVAENPDYEPARYGSLAHTPQPDDFPTLPPSLELPDPALDPSQIPDGEFYTLWLKNGHAVASPSGVKRSSTTFKDSTISNSRLSRLSGRRNTFSSAEQPQGRSFRRRLFSVAGTPFKQLSTSAAGRPADIPLEAFRTLDLRQQEFFSWMDAELEKIESFYILKEKESNQRLQTLKDQLHEMKDRRLEEVMRAQKRKDKAAADERQGLVLNSDNRPGGVIYGPRQSRIGWMKPLENAFDSARGRPQAHNIGAGTRALQALGPPTGTQSHRIGGDFTRETRRRDSSHPPPRAEAISYRTAKRKLKLAVQEYYRGLELLKSYALLNRKAFRKLNKKYDKLMNTKPSGRYMSEKVNKAYFVQSETLDGHLHTVEDLYAQYFERGNHKIAIRKLRSNPTKAGELYSNVYRNGLAVGAGVVLGIQGLVSGSNLLQDRDHVLRARTSYLLQIYAGYFLSLILFLLFCLNYWRQLSELPCMFVFLEGLCIWLNFNQYGGESLFIYYPVILIGVTVSLLAFPAKVLYHRSRRWWLYSNWRLLLAGLYPVEFRDFFLGDMYCSQTYTMGNLELFFCLYAQNWNPSELGQCNSQHSRLLGFFTTLPAIWRALQCLRRYYDTRNVFPHLANAGKYSFTILYYMSLSLYRIQQTEQLRALFVFFAVVNSVYCSLWDLMMDWSLGNPYARYPFLRDVLGYKKPWVYYCAMVLDPILRFNWIFYAVYSHDLQHSAILSFAVNLSEVFRRGLWTLFRVENEHCTNVGRFRASRDIPLPYEIPSTSAEEGESSEARDSTRRTEDSSHGAANADATESSLSPRIQTHHGTSATDIERQEESKLPSSSSLRLRPVRSNGYQGNSMARFGSLISQAHAQDFERRRKPGAGGTEETDPANQEGNDSSDDEDEDDEEDDDLDEDNQPRQRHRD